MSTHTEPPARRARTLALAAACGACLVAALGIATGLAVQTTIAGSEAALDTLRVNTLGGRDDVQVAPGVMSALITPVVDLGADQ